MNGIKENPVSFKTLHDSVNQLDSMLDSVKDDAVDLLAEYVILKNKYIEAILALKMLLNAKDLKEAQGESPD
jgi:hypothetical protein